jgi:hypothetical protein
MQKWEYASLFYTDNAPKSASQWNFETADETHHLGAGSNPPMKVLDHYGAEGWEVICLLTEVRGYLLKRPKP